MSRHPDAAGYLNDLAKEVAEPWFTLICGRATVSGISTLDSHTLNTLFALFLRRASYLDVKSYSVAAASAATPPAPDFLEILSRFCNFKRLEDTLKIEFKKRITIVFGANGSGKSSLCESLKVLANPEEPNRPLHNVRGRGMVTPGFSYKFRSDAATQSWTTALGYGPRNPTIKYFDAEIAQINVTNAVEPGRVIVLTPFKLHVFEWAKSMTADFREALQQAKKDNAANLTQALEGVRTKFGKFKRKGQPLALIDEKDILKLAAEIKVGEAFLQGEFLKEKKAAAVELEKASSEEGLKLLRAEHREMETFLSSVGALLDSAEGLWGIQPVAKAKDLAKKQASQELLVKTLIPENGTLEDFLTLLRAASQLCSLETAYQQVCPLCKRELDLPQIQLFKKYHDLLSDELEKEITTLRADLLKANGFVKTIRSINRKEWDKNATLPAEMLAEAKIGSDLISDNCDPTKEPIDVAQKALASLRTLCIKGAQLQEQKAKAIEFAEKDRDEPVKQLEILRAEIEPMEYAQSILEHLEELKTVQRLATEAAFWDAKLPSFTPLLRKITEAAKEAYEELIVSDFEVRLDAEYKALTENSMKVFGVKLARKGSEAAVTISPQIGGRDIEGILSEGEKRVHALALFFAEIETCPQSVIVFDDPISSFDYNYIANFCARLRDFAQNHPTHQIIVLTHNWEFFVQLQATLNTGGLNGQLVVQVMENCAVVADYSEKTEELKKDISAVLAKPSEPTKGQKEELAGKMRRLIEAAVNTHVFNKQRHQYKQKSQPVSEFQEFTRLVPLLATEATILRDLYAKLSITEHDDPRNAYINIDKATFQTRYDSIIAIEAAVVSRK